MPIKEFNTENNRNIILGSSGGPNNPSYTVRFDVFDKAREGSPGILSDLTRAEAHEIADWIKANVPEPHVQTSREFLNSLEPGTLFRHKRTGGQFVMLNGGRYIRTKAGPTSNGVAGDSYPITTADYRNPYEVIR